MRKLYEAVWLPQVVGGQIQVEKVSIGGRALTAIPLHGRLVELLTTTVQPPRVFTSVTPDKLIDLMRMGDGQEQARSYDVKRIIDTFYGTPGFPR